MLPVANIDVDMADVSGAVMNVNSVVSDALSKSADLNHSVNKIVPPPSSWNHNNNGSDVDSALSPDHCSTSPNHHHHQLSPHPLEQGKNNTRYAQSYDLAAVPQTTMPF